MATAKPEPGAYRILIVDDDADMRRGLSARLKTCGYDIAFAVGAVSVVSVAVKEKPELILLDIGLPGGPGFGVMQRLQNLAPLIGTPVIIVSAREPATHEKKTIAAGAQGLLPETGGHRRADVGHRRCRLGSPSR
jgi:two-component system KDP operon response regulator KdpE